MSKCILIGSGFLGSFVAGDILRFTENELLIVDKRNKQSVFGHRLISKWASDPRLKFKWQSSADGIRLFSEIKEADVIIYTSAIADVPYAIGSPVDTVNTNVVNMVQFMEALRAADFNGRMIHLSSESIYGHQPPEKLPIKEDECVPNPANVYGATKLAQELMVRTYSKSYGIRTVVLRSGTMYGPGSRIDQAIPIFLRQLLMNADVTLEGDGSQTRDFNYVTNMMDAIRICCKDKAEDRSIDGEVFNIASGRELAFLNLINSMKSVLKSQSKIAFKPWRPGEQGLRVALDISKAKEKLGYEPLIPMYITGMRNTAIWVANEVLNFNDESMIELQRLLGIPMGGTKIGETVSGIDQETQETTSGTSATSG